MKFSKTAELVEFTDCLPETWIYSSYKIIFDIWILFSKCKENTNLCLNQLHQSKNYFFQTMDRNSFFSSCGLAQKKLPEQMRFSGFRVLKGMMTRNNNVC